MKEWLTINELASSTGIPDTTVRRYIAKFSVFFVSKGGSRGKRYESSGVAVLVQIKDLYEKGLETEQVANELSGNFPIIIKSEEPAKLPAIATSDEITEVKQALVELKLSNDALLEALRERDEDIRRLLEESRTQLLELNQPTVNEPWWRKLISKTKQ